MPKELQDLVDSIHFYGVNEVSNEIEILTETDNTINKNDCLLLLEKDMPRKEIL